MSWNGLVACRCLMLAVMALPIGAQAAAMPPQMPFPQHVRYASGSIKPDHVPQAVLDRAVASAYDAWKGAFLRNGCEDGLNHVWRGNRRGGGADDNKAAGLSERLGFLWRGDRSGGAAGGTISISEGHGYGMIITALMAGHDPEARTLFDGLYRFYRRFPSGNHADLMAWKQLDGCRRSPDGSSASDGDLDIAYALLLADRQWGSDGPVDYKEAAVRIIRAIRKAEVAPTTGLVQLGDWVDPDEPEQYFAVRLSDIMPAHFKAFAAVAQDRAWLATTDASYELIETAQESFAPATGLVPDFMIGTDGDPEPAPPSFIGEKPADRYSWNACRVPWRVGMDFLLNGDERARELVVRMEDWFIDATEGDPARIKTSYSLDGRPGDDDSDLAFLAPLAVGAMLRDRHQDWLNALWDEMVGYRFDPGDYYGNTLRLLAMLVVSGNWWSPAGRP